MSQHERDTWQPNYWPLGYWPPNYWPLNYWPPNYGPLGYWPLNIQKSVAGSLVGFSCGVGWYRTVRHAYG